MLARFELNPAWQIGEHAREAVLPPFPPGWIGVDRGVGLLLELLWELLGCCEPLTPPWPACHGGVSGSQLLELLVSH